MNTKCSICLEHVQDSTNIIVAECGHIFHCLCLMTNVAFGCPHCRTKMTNQDADDIDDDEYELENMTFRFRRFLDDDAEEQWGAESDSCDEFGSGYGAVEDSDDDDDTNSLLQDDVMRGFRVVNGVDHDDADDADEEYYNIRCDPNESIADYNDNV